jgi:hypothetical protein
MAEEFVPSPEFLARVQRIQDAVELKQPDRIPIILSFGYFLSEYGGIMPTLYYEGVWDDRLEYLTQLPKSKTTGIFQDSDIFKVKEVVGDTLCIMGGMPIPLLKNGTAKEICAHTEKMCHEVGKGGGFIMCPTVLELEGISPENIQALADATKEFGVY